jgi:cyclopropane fatty-acyl-phospholipid synthase-like methyltransferase
MSEDKEIFENIYKTPGAGWTKSEPPAELVELVEKEKIKPCKAIDIGCGEGFYSIYLASKGIDVMGIDLSEQAIEYAKGNTEQAKYNIRFMVMDVNSLHQLNETFDFVLEWSVMHHIMPPQRQNYIKDISKILNKGGKYLSVCFSEQSHEVVGSGEKYAISPVGTKLYYSSQHELRELFDPYFRIIESKDITITGRHGQSHTANYYLLEKLGGSL